MKKLLPILAIQCVSVFPFYGLYQHADVFTYYSIGSLIIYLNAFLSCMVYAHDSF